MNYGSIHSVQARIRARDRRWTAVRAAGRIVVARAVGCIHAHGQIWPVTREEAEERRLWRSWDGTSWHSPPPVPELRRQIAVAGGVAECAWHAARGHKGGEFDPELVLGNVLQSDWAEGFPDVDLWDRVEPGLEAARAVWPMLKPDGALWLDLVRQSRDLIVKARWTREDVRRAIGEIVDRASS